MRAIDNDNINWYELYGVPYVIIYLQQSEVWLLQKEITFHQIASFTFQIYKDFRKMPISIPFSVLFNLLALK